MKCLPLLLLLIASLPLLIGGCGDNWSSPSTSPAEVAGEWWRAAASGDSARADGCLYGNSGRGKSALVLDEYARVKKAAGEGDPLAAEMLARLEKVRVGEVRSGPELAVVQLVMEDGKMFLTIRLELHGGRWAITDIK